MSNNPQQNNNPVFSSETYTAEVYEGNGNPNIVTIAATPANTRDRVTYSIVGGNDDGLFSIGLNSGIVRIAPSVQLDYESVASTNYTLSIEASDGTNTARTEVRIEILDRNDNAPSLSYSGGTIHFAENTSGVISAEFFEISDDDSSDVNTFSFQITGAQHDKFEVVDIGGIWALKIKDEQTLDAEEVSEITLQILVNDGAQSSNSIDVTVKIADINDEAPIFQPVGLNASVAENAAIGSQVTRVFATDEDEDAEVTYRIIDSSDAGFFSIGAHNGVVTLLKALDYETQTSYSFTIEASDGVHNTPALVTVAVLNVVEVDPVLTSSGTATVIENTIGKETGLSLQVADSESTEIPRFTITGDQADKFEIISDGATGWLLKVKAEETFDYEEITSLALTIVANNGAVDSNALEVTVEVQDLNDAAPQFQYDYYNLHFNEDIEINTALFTPVLTDADADNQSITLSISAGDDDGYFKIDNHVVRLAKPLDYETDDGPYQLTLQATDDAGNFSTMRLDIVVRNVNDNRPVISATKTTATITENIQGANLGIEFTFTDIDPVYENKYVISSTDSVDQSASFEIVRDIDYDFNTRILKLKENVSLDYETASQINLKVKMNDGIGDSNEIAITIMVENDNDQAPSLVVTSTHQDSNGAHYGQVTEADSTSTPTGYSVTITDLDGNLTPAGDYQFEIRDNLESPLHIADKFEWVMRQNQWILQLKTGETLSFDEESRGINKTKITGGLDVRVFDGKNWSEYKELTIELAGINNNAPTLAAFNGLRADVSEAVTGGGTGLYFTVADADRHALTKDNFVITGDSATQFTVARYMRDFLGNYIYELKLKSDQALNYDSGDTLNLKVKVNDGVFDSNVLDVVIRVHEVDSTLAFAQTNYVTFFAENTTIDANDVRKNEVLQVEAFNDDTSTVVRYDITAGNSDGLFAINADTGAVRLLRPLDAETALSHQLTVTAEDDDDNTATAQVVIHVQNKLDGTVAFAEDDIVVFLPENTDIGTLVKQLSAYNTDVSNRSVYSIVHEGVTDAFFLRDADHLFMVDEITGAIRTTQALDYETKQNHVLKVSVNENTFADLTVFVNDINDNAPIIDKLKYASVSIKYGSGGSDLGLIVDVLDADSDAVNDFTYTISGTFADRFELLPRENSENRNQWELHVKENAEIYYGETETNTYSIKINFNDGVHDSNEVDFDIHISEPTTLELRPYRYFVDVAETALTGTFLTRINAVIKDALPGQEAMFNYTIREHGDVFAVDAETGVVTLIGALDATTKNMYTFTVKVSTAKSRDDATININVLEVDEIVSFTGALTGAVQDDPSATEAIIATATLTNPTDANGDALPMGSISIQGATIDAPLKKMGNYGVFVFEETTSGDASNGGTWRYELDRSLDSTRILQPSDTVQEEFVLVYTTDGDDPSYYTATLTITITGEDDAFSFVAPSGYSFDIDESTDIDTIIGTVVANDPELITQPDIVYSITSGDTNLFAIDADTGAIRLKGAVDFESGTTRYTLEITATTANAAPTTMVQINVNDVNEAPNFSQNLYASVLAENAIAGAVVARITASDMDAGDMVAGYAIIGGNDAGLFTIDADTGTITLAKSELDFETATSHELTIEATDSHGKTNTARLNISITDVNDIPVFAETPYRIDLPEDATANDVLATIAATDGDTDDTLTYSITAGNDAGLFALNQITGVLTYIGTMSFDFETAQQSYDLSIAVSDGTATIANTAQISVSDVNEFAPTFSQSAFSTTQSENTLFVFDVSAKDADGAANLTYSITSGNTAEAFTIDETTGILSNLVPLDYESAYGHSYLLNIEVSDGTNTATTTVNVAVTDVDDNPPVLGSMNPVGTVVENVASNAAILVLTVEDADTLAMQGEIVPIITGDQADKFTLKKRTSQGEIFIDLVLKDGETLDYEEAGVLNLSVAFSDGTFTSNRQDVIIAVTDVDEPMAILGDLSSAPLQDMLNPPAPIRAAGRILGFLDPEGVVDVPAGSLALKAGTDTRGLYGDFSFTLDVGSNNAGAWAYVLDTAAAATRAISQDVVKKETFTLVYTTNSGVTHEADIVIEIIGANDQIEFNQPNGYAFSVTENMPSGTVVGTILANDIDEGAANDLVYSIISGNDDDLFIIDEDTGVITLGAPLDREMVSEHRLEVTAENQGSEPGIATADVTITVGDVNDTPPMFSTGPNTFNLPENTALNEIVAHITAIDNDVDAELSYVITSGNEAGYFSLGNADGILRVIAALDYETNPTEYRLAIDVSDGTHTATKNIVITLQDVDEAPQFVQTTYTASVSEDAEIDTMITRITAEDEDASSVLTYRISGGNQKGHFAIDENTGAVRVAGALDYETDAAYLLQIEVSDGDDPNTPAREGHLVVAELQMNVEDVNLQGVEFSGDLQGAVTEDTLTGGKTSLITSGAAQLLNAPEGVTWRFLTASEDSASAATQIETINNKWQITATHGLLEFDPFTGAWEYGVLNADARVQAIKSGDFISETFIMAVELDGETKKASLRITINGVDEDLHFIDDNGNIVANVVPELTLDVGDAAIGAPNGLALSANLAAHIGGLQSSSNLEFAFAESATDAIKSLFSVSTNGEISYIGSQADLLAYDGTIALELAASAPAETVEVLPFTVIVKPNLFFDDPSISALSVSESAEQGAVIGAISATNQGNNYAVNYRLLGSDANAKFSIDAVGMIHVKAALDYETTSSYSLQVEASVAAGATLIKTITMQVTNADDGPATLNIAQDTLHPIVGTVLTASLDTEDPDGIVELDAVAWEWFYKSAPDTSIGSGKVYTIKEDDRGEKIGVRRIYEDNIGDTSAEALLKQPVKRVSVNPESDSDKDNMMQAKEDQASYITAGDGADNIEDGSRNDVIVGGKGDDHINLDNDQNHGDEDEVIYTIGDRFALDGGDQIVGFTRGRDKFVFAMDSTPETALLTNIDEFLDYVRNDTPQMNDDQFLVQLNFVFLPDNTPVLDGLLFHFSNADYFDGGRISVPMVMVSFSEAVSKADVIAIFGDDKSDVHANVNGNGILTNLDYLDDLLGGVDALGFQINEVV